MNEPSQLVPPTVCRAVLEALPPTLSARDARIRKWLRIASHELEATGSPQRALERVLSRMTAEYGRAVQ
jgi:hypothetical protein